MTQLVFTGVTGNTPIQVYVADYYGNYQTFLGTITGSTIPVPPEEEFYPPALFNTAPSIMVILIDSSGCRTIKILDCPLAELIAIRTETYWPITSESGIILIP
jgi:hypothetical protein